MRERLARWPGEWSFFDAIDGSTLAPQDLPGIYDEGVAIRTVGRPLSRAEIGCALSHASVYRTILERGLDCALVLEDDARPHDRFFDFPYREITCSFDVVNFYSEYAIVRRRPAFRIQEVAFHRPVWETRGAVAYLISQAGARKLEAATRPLSTVADWPVDPTELRFFIGYPFLVDHTDGGSLIGEDRTRSQARWLDTRNKVANLAMGPLAPLASPLFIKYAMNRDRYLGVRDYMYRDLAPYVMRLWPFQYRFLKDS